MFKTYRSPEHQVGTRHSRLSPFFRRSRSLLYGFTLPWRALRLIIKRPKLLFWSVLPIGVTICIYITFMPYLVGLMQNLMTQGLLQLGLETQGWLFKTARFLAQIVIWILGGFAFSIVSNIVASPFNDFLAEAAEPYTDIPLSPPSDTGWSQAWKQKLQLLGIDLAKTLAAALGAIAAILLSWVPILNLGTFAFAGLLVTFQYISYAQTRRGIGLRAGAVFLWKHAYAGIGLGLTLSFLFAIPLISTVALPIAVVAGTLFVGRAPGDRGRQLLPLK